MTYTGRGFNILYEIENISPLWEFFEKRRDHRFYKWKEEGGKWVCAKIRGNLGYKFINSMKAKNCLREYNSETFVSVLRILS